MTTRSIAKTWVGREELEALLLISLKQKEGCSDLAGVCVYECGCGRWTIGHVRLGASHLCSEAAIISVERQFAKQFLLMSERARSA
jgi:hypothetical protein